MGSSKTANALMVAYNYKERGKRALLAKPKLDTREIGVMHSRIGLEEPCIYVEDLVEMSTEDLEAYDCIIVDEAQFCKKSDIEFFTHLVDDLEIPVICYGLRTDFQMHLFEGSMWLLAWADKIEELKTVLLVRKRCTVQRPHRQQRKDDPRRKTGGSRSKRAVYRSVPQTPRRRKNRTGKE